VGWKLGLAYCQFLPSPEAPVVLVLIIVVDIARTDDVSIAKALVDMARDNIQEARVAQPASMAKAKSGLRRLLGSQSINRAGNGVLPQDAFY